MSYSLFTKLIHWMTALIILGLLCSGLYMTQMAFSDTKFEIYGFHKSFGLLVLALAFIRVLWHVVSRKPKHLDTHKKWEVALSKIIHIFLYIALFVIPISGLVMSFSGEFPVAFFGITIPSLLGKDELIFGLSREVHEVMAFTLIGALGLHSLGALKHYFIDKDETLQRMTWSGFNYKNAVLLIVIFGGLYCVALLLMGQHIIGNFQKEETASVKIEATVMEPEAKPVMESQSATQWVIDKKNSSFTLEAKQYGSSFQGSFDFDGLIIFDEHKLDQSHVRIVFDIASIKTGSADRDGQAVSDEWFDVAQYPEAVFEAQEFENLGDDQYVAKGYLMIRDVTLPMSLPFTLLTSDAGRAEMNANIILNRLDFGVGQGQWQAVDAIANEVDIQIKLFATTQ